MLTTLDIRNNNFNNFDDLLNILTSLSTLEKLIIDINDIEHYNILKETLCNVQIVSNEVNNEVNNDDDNNDELSWNIQQKDLEEIAILYDNLRSIMKNRNIGNDKSISNQFDNLSLTVTQDINNIMKSENDTNFKLANISKSKFILYNLCLDRINDIIDNSDHSLITSMINIQKNLTSEYNKLFSLFENYVTNSNEININNIRIENEELKTENE